MAARGPVGQQFVSVDDYDVMVYPGFLRRPVRASLLSPSPPAAVALGPKWRAREPASPRLRCCAW